MKRNYLLLMLIMLVSSFNAFANDILEEELTSTRSLVPCRYNSAGHVLPAIIEPNNANGVVVRIYNDEFSVIKEFSITGLDLQEGIRNVIYGMEVYGIIDYDEYFMVSQYFFNDDDKYELVLCDNYSGNLRVVNEDGEITPLGIDYCQYFTLGYKNYIRVENNNGTNSIYSIKGQTGAPMIKPRNDTNGDGVVTASDVTSIYNEILGY